MRKVRKQWLESTTDILWMWHHVVRDPQRVRGSGKARGGGEAGCHSTVEALKQQHHRCWVKCFFIHHLSLGGGRTGQWVGVECRSPCLPHSLTVAPVMPEMLMSQYTEDCVCGKGSAWKCAVWHEDHSVKRQGLQRNPVSVGEWPRLANQP